MRQKYLMYFIQSMNVVWRTVKEETKSPAGRGIRVLILYQTATSIYIR